MSRKRQRGVLAHMQVVSASELAEVLQRLSERQDEQRMQQWAELWNWSRIEDPAGEC